MYVFPVSHFKVHVAFETGRAGEQSVFPGVFCSGGVLFSPLADENSIAF
jgi:hypothetical protein